VRILQNPALARRLALQGRQRAQHFTWDALGETVLTIYRALAGRVG
jgi:glycosyltransferase involved in cell wall biosynthesis